MFLTQGNKKVGFALLGSGSVLTMLGMTLFFEKNLLRLGNLLFLAGVSQVMGPKRMIGYFMAPDKRRGGVTFCLGVVLVFMGHPVLGMLLEFFGILNLFGNMFPIVWSMVKKMPFIRDLVGDDRKSNRQRAYQGYDQDQGRSRGRDYEW